MRRVHCCFIIMITFNVGRSELLAGGVCVNCGGCLALLNSTYTIFNNVFKLRNCQKMAPFMKNGPAWVSELSVFFLLSNGLSTPLSPLFPPSSCYGSIWTVAGEFLINSMKRLDFIAEKKTFKRDFIMEFQIVIYNAQNREEKKNSSRNTFLFCCNNILTRIYVALLNRRLFNHILFGKIERTSSNASNCIGKPKWKYNNRNWAVYLKVLGSRHMSYYYLLRTNIDWHRTIQFIHRNVIQESRVNSYKCPDRPKFIYFHQMSNSQFEWNQWILYRCDICAYLEIFSHSRDDHLPNYRWRHVQPKR